MANLFSGSSLDVRCHPIETAINVFFCIEECLLYGRHPIGCRSNTSSADNIRARGTNALDHKSLGGEADAVKSKLFS